MKQRLLILVKYYVFWIALFIAEKWVFMFIQKPLLGDIRWQDWFEVAFHGLPLDLSTAGYITAVFGLILCASYFLSNRVTRIIGNVYTGLLLGIVLCILIGDNGTFPSWGYHLDKSLFFYTPQEMLACAPWWMWGIGIVLFVGLFLGIGWLYLQCIRYDKLGVVQMRQSWWQSPLTFLITGLLFLPIRGGVTVSTMNTGQVYYSENRMLNLAAVNPVFNLFESLDQDEYDVLRYSYMSSQEAENRVKSLYAPIANSNEMVLKTQRPHVVFVIVESFSANTIEVLGGESGVTPCFNRLSEEGILFTNVYASSFRTDRGVVAALSGFPGQPTASIMHTPSKTAVLPSLSRSLLTEGYKAKFWYGGDEDFMNMRSYLINAGLTERVCDQSFPLSDRLSKWGVHDHVLLQRVAEEWTSRSDLQPTLDIILTSSSHEPFEVPMKRFDNPYLNSVAYADSCVGSMIEEMRQSPRWDSTLVVLLADHGYPYPVGVTNSAPKRYHIPVLMVGGAVCHPKWVETLGSQIDVVPTLLTQMGIEAGDYMFGKNLFNELQEPFAFYSFIDGFGLITNNDTVVWDAAAAQSVAPYEGQSSTQDNAKAFVQRIYETIANL